MNPHGKEDEETEILSQPSWQTREGCPTGSNKRSTPRKEGRNQKATMKSREHETRRNIITIKMSLNKLPERAKTNEYNPINFDGWPLMPQKQKCFPKDDELIMK